MTANARFSDRHYMADTITIKLRGNSDYDSYINAGNVGIGTTSPGEKLDVNGNIKVGSSNSYLIGSVKISSGSGAPTASDPNGSLYLRTDGTGPNLYVRENSSWVSK